MISSAHADEESSPIVSPLPPGVPAIPGPKEKDNVLLVTAKNESAFENLLLAPLASWLKDGKLAMRVVRNLEFRWEMSSLWEDASKRNILEYDLHDDHSLARKSDDVPAEGAPFGDMDDINNESDPVRKAYKILWNVVYLEGAARDAFYHVQIDWIGTQALLRSARGAVYRRIWIAPPTVKAAPAVATPTASPAATASPVVSGLPPNKELAVAPALSTTSFNSAADIVRQDVLRLVAPSVVSGFAEVSWRFRGTNRDRTWLYSPVLHDTRELLPANRGDAILGGNLAYDDLFVWSGKVQDVQARVADQKVLLVPVSALSYYRLEALPFSEQPKAQLSGYGQKEELSPASSPEAKPENVLTVRGFHKRPDGTNAMVLWNHQSRQLPQLAPWVPTTVTFVPRKTWIIEIIPQDPYSVNGREILIVDQESMLPVYKLVYDRVGEYKKTVIGAWGLARSKDAKTSFPFAAFVLALDQSAQSATSLTAEQIQTFLGKDTRAAGQVKTWLDPRKYPKSGDKKDGEEGEEAENDAEESEEAAPVDETVTD